jgi:hypothetical protein
MCCEEQSCSKMECETSSSKHEETTYIIKQSISTDLEFLSGSCGTSQDCDDFSYSGKLGRSVVL